MLFGVFVIWFEKYFEYIIYVCEWIMILYWVWFVIICMLFGNFYLGIYIVYGDLIYLYDKFVEEILFYNGNIGELMVKILVFDCRWMLRMRMRKLCLWGLDVWWGVEIRDLEVVGEDRLVGLFVGCDGESWRGGCGDWCWRWGE